MNSRILLFTAYIEWQISICSNVCFRNCAYLEWLNEVGVQWGICVYPMHSDSGIEHDSLGVLRIVAFFHVPFCSELENIIISQSEESIFLINQKRELSYTLFFWYDGPFLTLILACLLSRNVTNYILLFVDLEKKCMQLSEYIVEKTEFQLKVDYWW